MADRRVRNARDFVLGCYLLLHLGGVVMNNPWQEADFAERDCALELLFEERALREYEAHLRQHPHPADPDHPRKCDYNLEDDDE